VLVSGDDPQRLKADLPGPFAPEDLYQSFYEAAAEEVVTPMLASVAWLPPLSSISVALVG
jgi:hypothetical protein